jgi:hypothetical protein
MFINVPTNNVNHQVVEEVTSLQIAICQLYAL